MTTEEILKLTLDELSGVPTADLRKIVRQVNATANRRASRLEQAGTAGYSQAYINAIRKNQVITGVIETTVETDAGALFSTPRASKSKSDTRAELERAYARARRFLTDETSKTRRAREDKARVEDAEADAEASWDVVHTLQDYVMATYGIFVKTSDLVEIAADAMEEAKGDVILAIRIGKRLCDEMYGRGAPTGSEAEKMEQEFERKYTPRGSGR